MFVMKIMIDAEPLLAEQLTGIGYNLADTAKAYAESYGEDELCFSSFALRGRKEKLARLNARVNKKASDNIRIKLCPLLSAGMYRLAWGIGRIPIPYRVFFGGADIVHFYNFLIPPWVKGKRVCTVHDLAFKRYPETVARRTRVLLEKQLRNTLKRADAVVVVSEFTKRELLELYPFVKEEKIFTVYNGVDHSFFYPREFSDISRKTLEKFGVEKNKFFFYLGTIEPRKNLARAIEAYAMTVERLKAEGREVYPFILGGKRGWYCDEIFAKADKLGISELVKFIGYIEREEMAELYSHCTSFVFPSLYEGFGIPIAEAMACGATVIASNAASLPEVGGDAAIYCDPNSVKSICDAFYVAYSENGLSSERRELGKAQAARFTWGNSAKTLNGVYRSLC